MSMFHILKVQFYHATTPSSRMAWIEEKKCFVSAFSYGQITNAIHYKLISFFLFSFFAFFLLKQTTIKEHELHSRNLKAAWA